MFSKITPIFLTVFAIFYLNETTNIPIDQWSEADLMNSRSLPYLYGALLLFCLFLSLKQKNQEAQLSFRSKKLALILISLILFLGSLPYLSFWLSLSLLLAANMFILGQRKPIAILTTAVFIPTTCWLIIEKGLQIVLPI